MLKPTAAVMFALLLVTASFGQDLERIADEIIKQLPEVILEHEQRLEESEIALKQMKKGIVKKGQKEIKGAGKTQKFTFPSREEKEKAIEERESANRDLKTKIEDLKSGKSFHIGTCESLNNFWMQFPDPNKTPKRGDFGRIPVANVAQVLGPDEMIIKINRRHFMVRGVPTDGIVDGVKLPGEPLIYISGTETYETADGTNTVFSLHGIDEARLDELLKQKFKER